MTALGALLPSAITAVPGPFMKGWGAYELARRQAGQLQAEHEATSGRVQPTWAPGSMEWLAEQNKSS